MRSEEGTYLLVGKTAPHRSNAERTIQDCQGRGASSAPTGVQATEEEVTGTVLRLFGHSVKITLSGEKSMHFCGEAVSSEDRVSAKMRLVSCTTPALRGKVGCGRTLPAAHQGPAKQARRHLRQAPQRRKQVGPGDGKVASHGSPWTSSATLALALALNPLGRFQAKAAKREVPRCASSHCSSTNHFRRRLAATAAQTWMRQEEPSSLWRAIRVGRAPSMSAPGPGARHYQEHERRG